MYYQYEIRTEPLFATRFSLLYSALILIFESPSSLNKEEKQTYQL